MADPVGESTFWWVLTGTWTVGGIGLTALSVWVRGLADVSIEDRRMLWEAHRKQIRDSDLEDKKAIEIFATKEDVRNIKTDLERMILRQTEELRRTIENRGPVRNR